MSDRSPIYGLMAEFDGPDALREAAQRAYEAGYRRMDAYTPFPVEGLAEAIGHRHTRLPLVVLGGGVLGGLIGFGMQWYSSVIAYPINVGGRPYNSWPAFIPITFEMIVLFAALAALLGMLALNGLPEPYHPAFNVDRFELASRNRFFLCVESADPQFHRDETRRFLESLGPRAISEVEW